MSLGKQIREHRQRLGFSQETLARQMNVSRQAVTKWESDQSTPSSEKLFQLSELFGVSVEALLSPEGPHKELTVPPSMDPGELVALLQQASAEQEALRRQLPEGKPPPRPCGPGWLPRHLSFRPYPLVRLGRKQLYGLAPDHPPKGNRQLSLRLAFEQPPFWIFPAPVHPSGPLRGKTLLYPHPAGLFGGASGGDPLRAKPRRSSHRADPPWLAHLGHLPSAVHSPRHPRRTRRRKGFCTTEGVKTPQPPLNVRGGWGIFSTKKC